MAHPPPPWHLFGDLIIVPALVRPLAVSLCDLDQPIVRGDVNTVRAHRANMMQAMGVHKAVQLALYAVARGLVTS